MEVVLANREAVVICLVSTMILLSLPATRAYGTGPPVASVTDLCTHMTPGHGGTSQTTSPPYTIVAGGTCYTPQQPISGKISN